VVRQRLRWTEAGAHSGGSVLANRRHHPGGDRVGDDISGTTVVLTTQYLDEADQLADHIAVIDHGRLLTEGTPTQLKDRTCGAVIHLALSTALVPQALTVLESLSPRHDPGRDRIVLPAPDGPLTLQRVLRLLDTADLAPTDIALHRPTLDDVFLALTRANAHELAGRPT
jgi:ABC-2 type transport system ATP-binding protein